MCKILHIFVVINVCLRNFRRTVERKSLFKNSAQSTVATSKYDFLNFRKKSLIDYVAL